VSFDINEVAGDFNIIADFDLLGLLEDFSISENEVVVGILLEEFGVVFVDIPVGESVDGGGDFAMTAGPFDEIAVGSHVAPGEADVARGDLVIEIRAIVACRANDEAFDDIFSMMNGGTGPTITRQISVTGSGDLSWSRNTFDGAILANELGENKGACE